MNRPQTETPVTIPPEFDPQVVIDRLAADEFATKTTGIETVDLTVGRSRVRLRIDQRHVNALGMTQGGVLFTLADYALALAANTVPGVEAVGIEGSISFMHPSKPGDVLTAEAVEIARSRSLSSVEVSVRNEKGALLAKFHGRAFLRPRKD